MKPSKSIFLFLIGLFVGAVFAQTPAILKDINPVGNSIAAGATITEYKGLGYFAAFDPTHGFEVWRTDGTPGGTSLFMDIDTGANNSYPKSFAVCNGNLFFSATDKLGQERLWMSDGTVGNTAALKDISPYNKPSSDISLMTPLGNLLLFAASDAVHGLELWVSNGTPAGTFMLKDIDSVAGNSNTSLDFTSGFTVFKNKIYFAATSAEFGREVWMSDGTKAGTKMLKDINPGAASALSYPNIIYVAGNQLFFNANNTTNGYELWVSDGTTAGTKLAKDIKPGTGNSFIGSMGSLGGIVYFRADDGSGINRELWRSDGTDTGTRLLKDINTGSNYSDPNYFCEYNGKLYFTAYRDADKDQLWVTDGTNKGTVKAKDVNPASNSSMYKTVVYNGRLYFLAYKGLDGRQLFEYDANTDLLREVSPAKKTVEACSPGTYPSEFSTVNGKFIYPAVYDTAKAVGIEFYYLNTIPAAVKNADKKYFIILSPNPATNELRLTIPGLVHKPSYMNQKQEISGYKIMNLSGQVLMQGGFAGSGATLNIEPLKAGNYLIIVNNNGNQITSGKFIKN